MRVARRPQLGQPLSAKDYLEQCLAPAPGFSSDVTSRNRTRRVLTAYFKDRDCVTLVRPLEDEAKLQLVRRRHPEWRHSSLQAAFSFPCCPAVDRTSAP